jgi:cell division protein ZapD
VILYEYPFNERVRTYLRLEYLFQRLGQLMVRDTPLDHHFALISLFDVLDVINRVDLKSELLKELEKQKTQFIAFRGNPSISEASLDAVLGRLDDTFNQFAQQRGKPGHELLDNEWLMGVRGRSTVPAGTCSFDLPAYHAWQCRPPAERRADLEYWTRSLTPMVNAIVMVLQLLRDSGKPQKVMTADGQLQQLLPQGRIFQMLRLQIDEALNLVPEISGNRLMASVRLLRHEHDGRLILVRDNVPLEIALCGG